MSKIPTIEVHPAYVFDCDECGAENFVRAIVPEMSQEELDELRIEHGVQPWEAGQFTAFPNEVVCSKCGFRYATQHMCDDDEPEST